VVSLRLCNCDIPLYIIVYYRSISNKWLHCYLLNSIFAFVLYYTIHLLFGTLACVCKSFDEWANYASIIYSFLNSLVRHGAWMTSRSTWTQRKAPQVRPASGRGASCFHYSRSAQTFLLSIQQLEGKWHCSMLDWFPWYPRRVGNVLIAACQEPISPFQFARPSSAYVKKCGLSCSM
jgi:hypothetical protein